MARMGLDLTPENNVSDLLEGKMNVRKVCNFPPIIKIKKPLEKMYL